MWSVALEIHVPRKRLSRLQRSLALLCSAVSLLTAELVGARACSLSLSLALTPIFCL